MATPPDRNAALKRFAGRSLARMMRFVYRTSTVVHEPADAVDVLARTHPLIMASWHGKFMMLPFLQPKGTPAKALLAKHGDAEVVGEALAPFGVGLIRGSGAGTRKKDMGGAAALRGCVRALREGTSVVMTADAPPGPARKAGIGIITMARMSGRPIVPVAVASSRYKAFRTWSRMTLNLPFSKLAYVVGAPVWVPEDADEAVMERCRFALETELNRISQRSFELAGADPTSATPPPPGATAPPAGPGIMLRSYTAATQLARPAVPLLLALRERQGKEDPTRRAERFGEATAARPQGTLVWFHAASIGETNAILPVISAMADAQPELSFLLTTGTVTSAGLAYRRLGPRALHQYVPLDSPAFARRFLDHWTPDLAVFTESEIWPNLILATAAQGVPLALVNARMSARSFSRWRRMRAIAGPIFGRFDVVLAQNEVLSRRFRQLGAPRVLDAGNLKIDAPPPPADAQEVARLRQALAGRPVFVAASTHPGEDEIIAEAHKLLAARVPGLCTILAPRHPERGAAVCNSLRTARLNVAQRSRGDLPREDTGMYVADTVGELGTLYALAPVVFVGGSLVDRGGQNPIEAVRHGAAVLTGPSRHNFQDAYTALLRHRAAIEVSSAEQIAEVSSRLYANDAELARMRGGADLALSSLAGALKLTVDTLLAFLPSDERLRRAV